MRRMISMIAAAILIAGFGFGAYAQEESAEDSISASILELLTQKNDTNTQGNDTDYSGLYDSGNNDSDNTFDSSQNAAYAPAYTPASYDFYTLDIGSSGQGVTDLQQRLTDLGYLCDKVDGAFGKNTGTAVMSFKAQHGMDITSEATPEMQELLYSSNAEYYVEPYIPLVIGPQFRCEHSPYADMDHGNVWVQVVNRNMDRPVVGYTLYYYMTDVYGEHYIEPTTGVELTQKSTFQQTIRPGYIEYSEPIMIMPWSWTYRVYVGIQKIVFDDGEVREVDPDEIIYFYLDIKS